MHQETIICAKIRVSTDVVSYVGNLKILSLCIHCVFGYFECINR